MRSIDQRYRERLSSIPVNQNGCPDPREASRMKAAVRGEFWWELDYALNPGRDSEPGCSVQAPFLHGSIGIPLDRATDYLSAMKDLLGVQHLSLSTCLNLRPIFADILKDALSRNGMDKIACFVAAFARLELGQPLDTEYGRDQVDCPVAKPRNRDWSIDDETWMAISDLDNNPGWSSQDSRRFGLVESWEDAFNEPSKFEAMFPGMADRRLNMVEALTPIFKLDDFAAIETAMSCAKRLLQFKFADSLCVTNSQASPPASIASELTG